MSNRATWKRDVVVAGRDEVSIFVHELRYSCVMTEARDLTTDSQLEPDELVWLEERLVEYRELLEYLRVH